MQDWFRKWEDGDFLKLPITSDFSHTSPFGKIDGKENYLNLVKENQDKFLGYVFDIQDEFYDKDKACVRYRTVQGDFSLDVSEWFYFENNLIREIISYYHIGDIKEERQLSEQ